ncbi:hypothetical protein IE077_002281 [Cardiosporidium cionae]|uniref:Mitochondrial inner membrane protease subunit 2 n=1 Tax=Cardiosporidium cionae TaxID=476202 RepID=A0ABQ7JFU3_9APIC|nr:hypothetical protein IE077_002281 [Cardiosporidium cionae]|eukprot:KAF8822868.1 hypothetical protein IE077_002281 [Cardiosporidium cionae]
MRLLKPLWTSVKTASALIFPAVYISDSFFTFMRVPDGSMLPTLQHGTLLKCDWILVVRYGQLQCDDVVTLRCPYQNEVVVSRILAIESCSISKQGGPTTVIPKGHCWVKGDNHAHPNGCKEYEMISNGLIEGRAIVIVWPFARIGKISPAASKSFGIQVY